MAREVHLSVWLGETRRLTSYLPILVASPDGRPINQLVPSEIVLLAKRQLAFQQVLELVDPLSNPVPVYYMGPALPAPDVTGDIPIPPSRTVESVASPSGVIYLQAAISSAPAPGESPQLPPRDFRGRSLGLHRAFRVACRLCYGRHGRCIGFVWRRCWWR